MFVDNPENRGNAANFDPLRDAIDARLDIRIDAALRSYAEPPASISDPRTAAVAIFDRAQPVPSRRPFWIWAVPAAACLLALAVGVSGWLHAPPAPAVAHVAPPTPPLAVAHAAVTAPHNVSARVARHRHARPTTLPKLDIFPAPAPLSSQELALVTFVRHAPPAVTQAVIAEQRQASPSPGLAGLNLIPAALAGLPNPDIESPNKENP